MMDGKTKKEVIAPLEKVLSDYELSHGEARAMSVILLRAQPETGKVWYSCEKLAEQCGYTRSGLSRTLDSLVAKGVLTEEIVKNGQKLPSGKIASRPQSVYQLRRDLLLMMSAIHQNRVRGSQKTNTANTQECVPQSAPLYRKKNLENNGPVGVSANKGPTPTAHTKRKSNSIKQNTRSNTSNDQIQLNRTKINMQVYDGSIKDDCEVDIDKFLEFVQVASDLEIPLTNCVEDFYQALVRHDYVREENGQLIAAQAKLNLRPSLLSQTKSF